MMPTTFAYYAGQEGLLTVIYVFMLVSAIFWIVELVDVIRRRFDDPNMKIIWVLVICFLHSLGALLYYFLGKKQGTLPQ